MKRHSLVCTGCSAVSCCGPSVTRHPRVLKDPVRSSAVSRAKHVQEIAKLAEELCECFKEDEGDLDEIRQQFRESDAQLLGWKKEIRELEHEAKKSLKQEEFDKADKAFNAEFELYEQVCGEMS